MADLFASCLSFTLTQEGGYVDDPYDPGGATNMGITLATLRHWDHDPALGPANVEALTRSAVGAIYQALYWNTLRADALPAGVDMSAFDFGVNAGVGRSAMLLQEALGFSGEAVDGCIGPGTLAEVSKVDPATLIAAMADRQSSYYRGLAEFDRYGHGWLDRTERRKQAAMAMVQEALT